MRGNATKSLASSVAVPPQRIPPLIWDWDIEHADRKREAIADAAVHGSTPYQVDRRVLKDVVREKTGIDVGRITFLGAGELHPLVRASHSLAHALHRNFPQSKTGPVQLINAHD